MARDRKVGLGWPERAIVILLSITLLGSLILTLVLYLASDINWDALDPSGGDNVKFYEHQVGKFGHDLEDAAERGDLEKADVDAIFGDAVPSITWGGRFGDGYRIVAHIPAPEGYEPCHVYEEPPHGGSAATVREIPVACRE